MKRFLFIATILACALTSCSTNSDRRSIEEEHRVYLEWSNKSFFYDTFTLHGHDYIIFAKTDGGVVHDPDCRKCNGELQLTRNETNRLNTIVKIDGLEKNFENLK